MQDSYTDPKVEGTVWTAASRAAAGEYIQEQIEAHESIIRYYKSRHNALTVTCQIPPEILGIIFGEVAKLAEKSNSDDPWNHRDKFRWVRNVSHVCSHWRDVALSTPNLWSDIPLEYSGCVPEMLKRSKMSPLTISFRPSTSHRYDYSKNSSNSYIALKEVLGSRLSITRNLTLNLVQSNTYTFHNQGIEIVEIISLLDQPAPRMEQLELRAREGDSSQFMLPDALVKGLVRLKSLILEGCGMVWELSAFKNLQSLDVSRIPAKFQPSMPDLLAMLSQTPLLEKLHISLADNERSTGPKQTLPPLNAAPIVLVHLEDVKVSASLQSTLFLFNHLMFSRNAHAFDICVNISRPMDDTCVISVERLVQMIEKCVDGSIIRLRLAADGILFWKTKSSQTPPEPLEKRATPAAINITFNDPSALAGRLREDFWQSFALDKLASFELQHARFATNTATLWPFVGDLPHLQSLHASADCGEGPLLETLSRCPSFVALQSLTIDEWDLDITEANASGRLATRVVDCFKLRQDTGLGLVYLRVEDCLAVDEDTLGHLKEYIKEVDWDGNGNGDSDEDDSEDYGDHYNEDSDDESHFYPFGHY
ncbi:hypothetical protein DXG01_003180 [Tephrocybe rancida]|nr:hypothetical protein DXG01_003180 [Tephrocybe rancida]